MTISSYNSTYEAAPTTSEDSMFGAPIYARRVKGQDRNNKIFLGAAAVGVLVAAGALFFATSAANDREDAPAVAAAGASSAGDGPSSTGVCVVVEDAAASAACRSLIALSICCRVVSISLRTSPTGSKSA